MPGDMKKKPPHFEKAEEYYNSPRSDKTEKSDPETFDEAVNGIGIVDGKVFPPFEKDPTPMYSVLAPKDEEGKLLGTPPKECIKFKNSKDPDGRLGILAGLVMH